MNWLRVHTVCLTISLTAFAFEGYSRRMVVKASFCEMFGGTFLGYFCPRGPAGGGASGAR
jgi:hypothetical protein